MNEMPMKNYSVSVVMDTNMEVVDSHQFVDALACMVVSYFVDALVYMVVSSVDASADTMVYDSFLMSSLHKKKKKKKMDVRF